MPENKFNYNAALFNPPAPALKVELRSPAMPETSTSEEVIALIDTGADISCIPLEFVRRLDLKEVDSVRFGRADEREEAFEERKVYSVHLTVPLLPPMLARVVPLKSSPCAILGRDLINNWLLKIDGQNLIGAIS